MEKIKIAINGFGRIGRLSFRQMFEMPNCQIVAINDLAEPEMLAHLLKYDSMQGKYDKYDINVKNGILKIGGTDIKLFSEPDPKNLPWGDLGIDIVLECSGFFASKSKSEAHLSAGAKRVLISAPAGNDLPTVVYNVNHNTLKADDKIVSAASCTTNCLAPMAKALNDFSKITSGFMLTIHAYTGDQMVLDGPHRKNDLRRARAAAINIVPNSTGAAKAIGLVIPELAGKLTGSAQRVPVPSGSLTMLEAVVKSEKEITIENINKAMQDAANESFGYTDEEIVSSDIVGMSFGSLFDATQTMVSKLDSENYHVRVVSWYDNEASYVAQLVRTLAHMAAL
ncbi:MAG: type I glyceraldehyde-3-phosphate dehydrogenase [Eubacteriales bacterium]